MGDARQILTPTRAETYARDGVVRLPGAIPSRDVKAMAARLWQKLETRGKSGPRPSGLSSRAGAFDAMASPMVRGVLGDLLGDWEEPASWGLPLVSFHTGEATWDVPRQHWHMDFGRPGATRLARLFAVLEPSRPGGGGTGYVAGSHRLIQRVLDDAEGPLASAGIRRHPPEAGGAISLVCGPQLP